MVLAALLQGCPFGVDHAAIPVLERGGGGGGIVVFPEISRQFFVAPGLYGLPLQSEGAVQDALLLVAQVLRAGRPDVFGVRQPTVVFQKQHAVLVAADLINRVGHQQHDMEAIMYDLLFGQQQGLLGRLDVGGTHVHRDGLDGSDCSAEIWREQFRPRLVSRPSAIATTLLRSKSHSSVMYSWRRYGTRGLMPIRSVRSSSESGRRLKWSSNKQTSEPGIPPSTPAPTICGRCGAERMLDANAPPLVVCRVLRHSSRDTARKHNAPGDVQKDAGVL
jgi:hypothetical protein